MIFIGPSGCGKSTLALELIERGATLIADDQIILHERKNEFYATCPDAIRNKLHLDGVGLLHLKTEMETRIDLVFQSDLPATKLSCLPPLNKPVIKMDFKMTGAPEFIVDFVVKTLTLFDLSSAIP